jgi:ABC-2 type transport system ATP-binding protein
MGADVIIIQGAGDSQGFIDRVNALPYTEQVTSVDGMIHIGVGSGSRRLVEIVSLANESGFHIDDVSVSKPSLGDVFLKFTGRQFRD